MSFSSTVKEELIRLPLGKSCCMLSEISALTATLGSLSLRGAGHVRVTWRMENAALARRIFLLVRGCFSVTPRLHFVQKTQLGKRRECVLTLDDEDARKVLLAMRMMEPQEDGTIMLKRMSPRHSMTKQCCRKAFLRAAFMGAGTMSAPEKGYHLEWTADDDTLFQTLGRVLDKCDLPVRDHIRKGHHIVYLKGSQQIADTLALMGASNARLQLENIRIQKQMRLDANRASNCDEHNTNRQINAGQAQAEEIRAIALSEGLYSLPATLREIAVLRMEHPDMSLTDLGRQLDPPIGKSGVNHRLRRLHELAVEIEKEQSGKQPAEDAEEGSL